MIKRLLNLGITALLLAVMSLVALPPTPMFASSASFIANTNDARLNKTAAVGGGWAAVHDAADASNAVTGENTIYASIYKDVTNYSCERGTLEFDTSSLPDTVTITSAYVALYGSSKDNSASSTQFTVVLVNGADIASPPVVADYGDLLNDTTEYASSLPYASWSTSGYNNLLLNSTGIASISLTGTTKFGVRISTDIDNTTPNTGWDNVGWNSSNAASNKPTLYVTYSAAISTNAATLVDADSATLNGTVLAASTVRGFDYAGGYTPGSIHSASAESSTDRVQGTGTDFNVQDITIEAWIEPGATKINDTIFATNVFGITNGIEVKWDVQNDQIGFEYAAGAATFETNSWIDCGLVVGNTYHLVFTFNDGNLYLYINGVLKTGRYTIWDNYSPRVDTYGDYIDNSGYPTVYYGGYTGWAIGALNGGKNVFNGDIYEVRFYNRALTASEAANNYRGATARSGIVGEWLFEEASGATAYDNVNSHDGTITNFTWSQSAEWTEAGAFGAGVYSHGISSLTSNTVYHYRAKATIGGTVTYGSDVTFTTTGAPSIQTNTASGIGATTATLNGTLLDLGAYSTVYVSFQYGTTTSYGTNTAEQTKTAESTFTQAITGLTASTTYHYRAIVRYNTDQYEYGEDSSFAATALTLPSITTNAATNVAYTSATLQGTLSALGDYTPVYVSFEYGLTVAYGTTTVEQTLTATSGFNTNITGLAVDTTYHFRARVRYAAASYVNGSDASFATPAGNTLSINSVNVFTDYSDTGDWLIVAEVENISSPYYNVGNVSTLFVMQLLGTDDATVIAATPLNSWGMKPVAIYLSADTAASLSYGAAYHIKVTGTYAAPPSTDYELLTADWRGSNLDLLDRWVIDTATRMNTYYDWTDTDNDMLTNVTGQGTRLSIVGGAWFTPAISSLQDIRPTLFVGHISSTAVTFGDSDNTYDAAHELSTQVGSDIAADFTAIGNVFGISSRNAMAIGMLVVIVGFGLVATGNAGTGVGVVVIGMPLMLAGANLGIFAAIVPAMVAILALYVFVRRFFWTAM